jgi:hypothetical protein
LSPERGLEVKEYDQAVLTVDLPESGLCQGDVGTVVMVYDRGAGFEVEFVALNGETVAVLTLKAGQVRPVREHEIAHARRVAS